MNRRCKVCRELWDTEIVTFHGDVCDGCYEETILWLEIASIRDERDAARERCTALEAARDHERESGEFWRGELRKVARVMEGANSWAEGTQLEAAVKALVDDAAKLKSERDLALAKSKAWQQSRDQWRTAYKRTQARNEVEQLRDALIAARAVIENAEHVLHYYDVSLRPGEDYPVEPYGEIGPMRFAGRVCSDLYAQLFAIKRVLSEPEPFEDTTGAASDHAPDGLTPLSAQVCAKCHGRGEVSRLRYGVGMTWEQCECKAEAAAIPPSDDSERN